jgi:hypothetical protein
VLGLASADDQIDKSYPCTYLYAIPRSRLTLLPHCTQSCQLHKQEDLTTRFSAPSTLPKD